jgi:hypothetical protein
VNLREDTLGAFYEVPLLDTAYVELLRGLRAGLYGASFSSSSQRDDWAENSGDDWAEDPGRSETNPSGLPSGSCARSSGSSSARSRGRLRHGNGRCPFIEGLVVPPTATEGLMGLDARWDSGCSLGLRVLVGTPRTPVGTPPPRIGGSRAAYGTRPEPVGSWRIQRCIPHLGPVPEESLAVSSPRHLSLGFRRPHEPGGTNLLHDTVSAGSASRWRLTRRDRAPVFESISGHDSRVIGRLAGGACNRAARQVQGRGW